MYYVGWSEPMGQQENKNLMVAESDDGITWSKYGRIYSFRLMSDVMATTIDGGYRIYFSDKDDLYAIDSSDGLTVSEFKGKVLQSCSVGFILKVDTGYRLYHTKSPRYDPEAREKIYSASSPDGISFTEDSGVRMENADAPCVVKLPDGRFRMYYQAPPPSRKAAHTGDHLHRHSRAQPAYPPYVYRVDK